MNENKSKTSQRFAENKKQIAEIVAPYSTELICNMVCQENDEPLGQKLLFAELLKRRPKTILLLRVAANAPRLANQAKIQLAKRRISNKTLLAALAELCCDIASPQQLRCLIKFIDGVSRSILEQYPSKQDLLDLHFALADLWHEVCDALRSVNMMEEVFSSDPAKGCSDYSRLGELVDRYRARCVKQILKMNPSCDDLVYIADNEDACSFYAQQAFQKLAKLVRASKSCEELVVVISGLSKAIKLLERTIVEFMKEKHRTMSLHSAGNRADYTLNTIQRYLNLAIERKLKFIMIQESAARAFLRLQKREHPHHCVPVVGRKRKRMRPKTRIAYLGLTTIALEIPHLEQLAFNLLVSQRRFEPCRRAMEQPRL